jgi:flagellar hook-basal body complex protein FliE
MSDFDVAGVLSQIRALGAQASVSPKTQPSGAAEDGFASLLKQALERTDTSQRDAARLQQAFEVGDPKADLASVMLTTAKAQVSFRALVEVRNRLVSAYQDIMNMPI